MVDKKRVIKGFKSFGKSVAFKGGKYGLKAALKVPELAVRGGSRLVNALSKSDQFQIIATTGGIIAASVMCPPIFLGAAGMVAAKYAADKMLDKPQPSIGKSIKETIMLGNKVTKLACDKVISPATQYIGDQAKNLGKTAQSKVDQAFDRE